MKSQVKTSPFSTKAKNKSVASSKRQTAVLAKNPTKVTAKILRPIARKSIAALSLTGQHHIGLALGSGTASYPKTCFVNEKNKSLMRGIDLRESKTYRRLLDEELKSALAMQYQHEIRLDYFERGLFASRKFTRDCGIFVLSEEIKTQLLAIEDAGESQPLPCHEIVATLTEDYPRQPDGLPEFDCPAFREFWESTMELEEDEYFEHVMDELHGPYASGHMLLSHMFAAGFIYWLTRD